MEKRRRIYKKWGFTPHFYLFFIISPFQPHRSPCKSRTKCSQNQVISFMQTVFPFIQTQRNRTCLTANAVVKGFLQTSCLLIHPEAVVEKGLRLKE